MRLSAWLRNAAFMRQRRFLSCALANTDSQKRLGPRNLISAGRAIPRPAGVFDSTPEWPRNPLEFPGWEANVPRKRWRHSTPILWPVQSRAAAQKPGDKREYPP